MRNIYEIFVRKPEVKKTLLELDIGEMIILKEILQIGCETMDWILLADDRVQCLYLVNTVI